MGLPQRASLALALLSSLASAQQVPDGYPAGYAELIRAAEKEGAVTIYSSTDSKSVAGVLQAFQGRYPKIKVEFVDQSSNEVYTRFTSEFAAGQGTGDLAWGGADTAVKLIEDGIAAEYTSPETGNLRPGANYRNAAYSITYEPIVMIYNKRLLPAADVPKTRQELTRVLTEKREAYRGKIGTYDVERSAAGIGFLGEDSRAFPDTAWPLFKAMAQADLKFFTSNGTMVERVASGEIALAYNLAAANIAERLKTDTTIGMIVPCDYTLYLTRTAIISKKAKHPNAAKVFLDYLLSKEGQQKLADKSIGSIRTDVQNNPVLQRPAECKNERALMPSPERLVVFDPVWRGGFLKQWKTVLQAK
ncbi:ABC transporter substrate-binding protein [Variovorax sp. EBFNA2]|uniref:ABC transporter substrate-binding protein n=1 Tax=Variovorax sp. EBFNA2 TaxID=3342097 RepID=UPI0029C05E87|nr:ABC transporter substrate-binding protein [Variovorax boronicumulans]WPG41207.1 ABC transporter substrate-binding protein [Variovorax boronicumulans]